MLDFLRDLNISYETINYMNDTLSTNEIMALKDNKKECLKIIALFNGMGIDNVEDLLINETYIFLKTSNRVFNELSKHDIKEIIKEVNEDYASIEDYI